MAENNIVRLRGAPVTTAGLAAGQCLLNTSKQTIATICQPSKLWIKSVVGDFDLTSFTGGGGVIPRYGEANQNALDPHACFSGFRTGITFEGPFMMYTIAQGAMGMNRLKGTHNNAALPYIFDLVGDRMLYLPYPGTVEIFTQYPGTWDVEVFIMESGFDSRMPFPGVAHQPTALDADATLTMRLASSGAGTATTRDFNGLPPGTHSLTVNNEGQGTGGVFPSWFSWQETSPVRGAAGFGDVPINTSVECKLYGGVSSAFMNRVGHNNSWGGSVNTGINNSDGFVQWHIGYT